METNNRRLNVDVNGKIVRVRFLNGSPWYAEVFVRRPGSMTVRSAFTRSIWHRANGKPLSGLAKAAFDAAAV